MGNLIIKKASNSAGIHARDLFRRFMPEKDKIQSRFYFMTVKFMPALQYKRATQQCPIVIPVREQKKIKKSKKIIADNGSKIAGKRIYQENNSMFKNYLKVAIRYIDCTDITD
jgi:hypothetical protein